MKKCFYRKVFKKNINLLGYLSACVYLCVYADWCMYICMQYICTTCTSAFSFLCMNIIIHACCKAYIFVSVCFFMLFSYRSRQPLFSVWWENLLADSRLTMNIRSTLSFVTVTLCSCLVTLLTDLSPLFPHNNNVLLTRLTADLTFTKLDYTTKASFKSLLINFHIMRIWTQWLEPNKIRLHF